MSKEVEKKGLGWFKGNKSADTDDTWENIIVEKELAQAEAQEEPAVVTEELPEQTEIKGKALFSKEDLDKVSLDLVVSVENLLKDRQFNQIKRGDLEKRLQEANETISRYKHDLEQRDKLVQEKNSEIQSLENSLSSKQMNYDQLLEDYKEFQQNANADYEQLSDQLETAQGKYESLNEEFTKSKYDHMLKINELEERIRTMEIENKKYATQYKQILEEKNELMQTINDFTERMSFSFQAKASSTSSDQAE